MQQLSLDDFHAVRRNAPLVAIDLIIEDPAGRILLGYRNNEPAKDSWFVPGGRIRKDERLAYAFSRIILDEFNNPAILGISDNIADAAFMGVYEHMYPATETTPYSIHCVILAYRLKSFRPSAATLPQTQHNRWQWLTPSDLKGNETVHPYTRAYFP
jgi:colanic acid biosynthesis protein WcaH